MALAQALSRQSMGVASPSFSTRPGAAVPTAGAVPEQAGPTVNQKLAAITSLSGPVLEATARRAQEVASEVTPTKVVQTPAGPMTEGGAKAVQWAAKHLGVRERSGSNRGPTIDRLQRQFGFAGAEWCGIFVAAMARSAGAQVDGRRTAYVPTIISDARSRSNGYRGWTTNTRAARPGDFVVLFGGSHVEMVQSVRPDGSIVSVGGNTSTPGGGQGVARKVRPRSAVTGVAQVAY